MTGDEMTGCKMYQGTKCLGTKCIATCLPAFKWKNCPLQICRKTFVGRQAMLKHKTNLHGPDSGFKCPVCNVKFR
jgi:hypothetical protein